MIEYNPKVKFHGKEMNLLEARLYSVVLKLRIAKTNLKEEEMGDYLKWENEKFIKNKRVKELTGEKIFKNDERQYLIEKLGEQIKYAINEKKRIHCNKYGHKELKGSSDIKLTPDGTKVYTLCSKCNTMYERKATNEELKKAKNKIYNPFEG